MLAQQSRVVLAVYVAKPLLTMCLDGQQQQGAATVGQQQFQQQQQSGKNGKAPKPVSPFHKSATAFVPSDDLLNGPYVKCCFEVAVQAIWHALLPPPTNPNCWCAHAVLMLCSCRAHAVLMPCSCCAHAVLMLCPCRARIVCCTHAVLVQGMNLGVALPEWMFTKDSKAAPLMLLVLVGGGILLPMALMSWYMLSSSKFTGPNQIMNDTLSIFWHPKYGVKESQVGV
jgi:hypothetical protein